jgi:hypothetical protein
MVELEICARTVDPESRPRADQRRRFVGSFKIMADDGIQEGRLVL